MAACKEIKWEMLGAPISISEIPGELTFQEARRLADREAEKHSSDPMLLAWYDRKTGTFSPKVE